jgi:tight adherence protein C
MTHLWGAMIGLAVFYGLRFAKRGWAPRQQTLAERLAAASQPPKPRRSYRDQLLAAMSQDLGAATSTVSADLAVLDRTPEEYAAQRLTLVAGLAFIPVVFAFITGVGGVFTWTPIGVVVVSVVGAGFGFAMSRAVLTSQAAARRQAFAAELSQFLDVVALQIAGSSGIDEALRRAANSASSPGIVQIRRAMDRSRLRNEEPWDALEDLAERIRVPELDELVSTVRLGEDRGARIKNTLMAKADSLRATLTSEELSQSEKASERMGVPVVFMFFGFLLLTIAPLMSQLGSL